MVCPASDDSDPPAKTLVASSDGPLTGERFATLRDWGRNGSTISWLVSCCFHLVLLTAIGLTTRWVPRGALLGETREVGIALVHQGATQRAYSPAPAGGPAAAQAASPAWEQALPPLDELPLDLPGASLSAADLAGGAEPTTAGTGQGDAVGPGSLAGAAQAGTTRLSVFGVTGEGSKFVFVFDRSGSMDGYGGAPLRAAKAELNRSLEQLDKIHQFQIVFYNERPLVFNPTGGTPRLVWGDSAGKAAATRYIEQVTAGGGTQHLDALQLALGMAPDVIFFLTDADEPRLSDSDLARIRKWNRHTAIHAIEFGHGRQADRRNFLVQLAEQNGGQHAYVDISRL